MNFENHVQSAFVVLMLAGGFVPCFPGCSIKKINLQGKHLGYDTDDLIVFVERPGDGQEKKLLGQIKHSLSITERDKVFGEVIEAAWNDFSNPKIFTKGKDSIALITGPLSATDTSDVRSIFEWARSLEDSGEFIRNIELTNFSSKMKQTKLKAFRLHLKKANGGQDVPDEDIFQFLRHFHLLGYDLDIKTGVTLSLLHSLIGQYSVNDAQNIWSRIIDEVQSSNQNAGTITIDSLPDDIKLAFQRPFTKAMPSELTRTPLRETDWNQAQYASELAVANLLGSWSENSDADKVIAGQLAKEDFDKWIPKIQEILQQPGSPVSLKNGTWTITERNTLWQALGSRLFDDHLDIFEKCVVKVLRELDPKFDLPPEEGYAAGAFGKTLKHSHHLRKGLAESLAIWGNYPSALNNCSMGKPGTITHLAVRNIFDNSDWKLWGSLDRLLPLLAEAAPNEFLSAVETALQKTPCPFDMLFSQEGKGIIGDNYITGLLWALETLAWDQQYLVRVSIILGELASHDPGGNWANRPSNSLTTIFLPWLPQTTASIEKRKVAIQTLQKEIPSAAWKLLLSLLPNQHQASSGSRKPTWLNIIPEDWSEKVTQKEYWNQVTLYADMTVEMAKYDISRLGDLIKHLHNLPQLSFEKVLEYLPSEDITGRPESEKLELWSGLTEFVSKHKKYADAKWALNPDLVSKIEDVARMLAPQNPLNLHRRLFTSRDFELFEEKGNWQEQQKKLDKYRQQAIKEILNSGGIQAVIRFADTVESPWNVGLSLGFTADFGIDTNVLPNLLKVENKNLMQFASGFIWGRYQSQGWTWVDAIDKTLWSHSQIGQFLACLPFNVDTWKRSKEILGEYEVAYWSNANVTHYQAKGEMYVAIDKLLEYGRPNAAIACLHKILSDNQPLDKTRTIKTLRLALSSTEPSYSMDAYAIVEIIKALQDDTDTNPNDLFKVEWDYLPLLDRYGGASPRLLENRLASDPDFFCEVIRFIYRSKKEPKSEKEPTEQDKNIATNAYRLLREWRTPPGTQADGSLSEKDFKKWLESTKAACIESGHIEVALTHVGHVLFHCPPDPDGLWINRAVAEALNAKDAEDMRNGFRTALFNSRGVHAVDPSGKPELELSAKYRKQAEEVENAGYQRLAATLRALADWYSSEAKRVVDEHKQEEVNDT